LGRLPSFFFFGGLSIHLSQALLAHMFSYNITWGATKKEVERSNFWLEVPKILKRFWLALVICIAICALMIVLSTDAVPVAWQIPRWDWAVILPLAITTGSHILYPVRLFIVFTDRVIADSVALLIDCAEPLVYDFLLLNTLLQSADRLA
jgi:hypothetical protein